MAGCRHWVDRLKSYTAIQKIAVPIKHANVCCLVRREMPARKRGWRGRRFFPDSQRKQLLFEAETSVIHGCFMQASASAICILAGAGANCVAGKNISVKLNMKSSGSLTAKAKLTPLPSRLIGLFVNPLLHNNRFICAVESPASAINPVSPRSSVCNVRVNRMIKGIGHGPEASQSTAFAVQFEPRFVS